MTETTHFQLKKPDIEDYVSIAQLNENADTIDTQLAAEVTQRTAADTTLQGQIDTQRQLNQTHRNDDTLHIGSAQKDTPADADALVLVDGADGGKSKRLLWEKVKGMFAAVTHRHSWSDVDGKPTTYTPSGHKDSHKVGGTDALSAGDIGVYSKDETLRSATKTLLGLGSDALPNEAFMALLIGVGKYGYSVHVTFKDGSPVVGRTISGISSLSAGSVVTDQNGYALGVSSSSKASISISFSDYIDLENVSMSISSTGAITNSEIVVQSKSNTSETITSSRTIMFSSNVKDYDVALVGGGGGGGSNGHNNYSSEYYGGGGGGGGYVANRFGLTKINAPLTVIVGAGASGNQTPSASGGTTSISQLSISANGGQCGASGGYSHGSGGANGLGNGYGGDGQGYYSGSNGSARSTYPFNDSTIKCSGGGAGGNKKGKSDRYFGGDSYGGNGGYSDAEAESGRGIGGGGGGGGTKSDGNGIDGKSGYGGGVFLRWRNR